MNDSADFVMYWWDHAAELLTRKKSLLLRFGLVTTNSISQVFQRRVLERHLTAKDPVSLVMAVPDHPWTKAGIDAAAVRIAMTVVEAGTSVGVLRDVVREEGLDTDSPLIEFSETVGIINSDLTVGVDVTKARPLLANQGLVVSRCEAARRWIYRDPAGGAASWPRNRRPRIGEAYPKLPERT